MSALELHRQQQSELMQCSTLDACFSTPTHQRCLDVRHCRLTRTPNPRHLSPPLTTVCVFVCTIPLTRVNILPVNTKFCS